MDRPPTIVLLRHAQSQSNVETAYTGQHDLDASPQSPLSNVGVAQSYELAAAVRDLGPTIVLSSPFTRAQQTMQSFRIDRIVNEWREYDATQERWDAFTARVKEALDAVQAEIQGGVYFIVTHSLVISVALEWIVCGYASSNVNETMFLSGNAAATVIQRSSPVGTRAGGWRVLAFNALGGIERQYVTGTGAPTALIARPDEL